MGAIFKVFVEFVTTLLLLYVLVFCPQGMWDLTPRAGSKLTPPALEGEALTPDRRGRGESLISKFRHVSLLLGSLGGLESHLE